jgi:hypothetical protein
VDSPLKITLRIPWSNGSPDTALAAVTVQLLDGSGNPARIGPGPGEPDAMRPALEIGVWTYDGSMPSDPGTYHPRFVMQKLNGPTETVELNSPELTSLASDGPPVSSGYVYARNANLWLLSTDTQRERRLTFLQSYYEYADNASWSPDGKEIGYTYSPKTAADELPFTEIWALGADGTGAHKVVGHGQNESLLEPVWSPDGKSLYFTVQTQPDGLGTPNPLGMLTNTGRVDKVELATGSRTQWMPNASMPDVGTQGVVYVESVLTQDETGGILTKNKLQFTNADGAQSRTLVDENKYQQLYAPSISPDGKWVVFAATDAPPPQASEFDFWKWLTWQPETASAHGLPWDLYIVPLSGGEVGQITQLNEDQPHATWLDATTIAFMGKDGLYKLGLDATGKPTGQPARIHNGSPHGGLSWHAP